MGPLVNIPPSIFQRRSNQYLYESYIHVCRWPQNCPISYKQHNNGTQNDATFIFYFIRYSTLWPTKNTKKYKGHVLYNSRMVINAIKF